MKTVWRVLGVKKNRDGEERYLELGAVLGAVTARRVKQSVVDSGDFDFVYLSPMSLYDSLEEWSNTHITREE